MKFNTICASAIALTFAISSPAKADANEDFVGMMVITAAVLINCPGYESVDGGFIRYADANGVDLERYGSATFNALQAISGHEYDRSKLIPSVTQYIRNGMTELGGEIIKLGKPGFCKKYAPAVVNTGIVTKVVK